MNENNNIICPSCGAENTKGKKFCKKCGKPLPMEEEKQEGICPECGAELEEGALFCGECGFSFKAPKPEPIPEPENSTVICPSCGAENQRGKKFCMKCGSKLTAESGDAVSVKALDNADKSAVKSKPVKKAKSKPGKVKSNTDGVHKKSGGIKLFAVITAAVLIIAGAAVCILLFNSSEGLQYDYDSLGFSYHIEATQKKKIEGSSAKYNKKYNDTAVSIMKAAYEYIDTLEFEERFTYLGLSDSAYEILSETTNSDKLALIDGWKNDPNNGHYIDSLSGADNPMGKYICENFNNYTNVPDEELCFLILWSDGKISACFVGSEDNMNRLMGDTANLSGKLGAAVTGDVKETGLNSDESSALLFVKAAYDFEDSNKEMEDSSWYME